MGQPSISSNPISTYSSHAIHPPARGIHSINFVESDDHIHMLSWGDQGPESIVFDDGYGDDAYAVLMPSITPVWIPTLRSVTLSCYSVQTPFILTPRQGTFDTPEI